MDLSSVEQIFNLIAWAVIAIIASAGLFYGIYALWDGFTNDQPEGKKKGFTVLLVTVIAIVVLIVAKTIIWNMIITNMPG